MANLGDLHTHTNYSDGRWTTEDWGLHFSKNPHRLYSITDHDTLEFYSTKTYFSYQTQILPGVELSCQHDYKSVHLLLFGKLKELEKLNPILSEVQSAREKRFERIIGHLKSIGLKISDEPLSWSASRKTSSNLAQYCKKYSLVEDCSTFYSLLSSFALSGYIGFPSLSEVLESSKTFALAKIIAHPASLLHKKKTLLEELIAKGMNGLEVYHPIHKRCLRKYYKKLCKEYGLLCSGGSDFHGYHNYQCARSGLDRLQLKSFLNGMKAVEMIDSDDFQAWS